MAFVVSDGSLRAIDHTYPAVPSYTLQLSDDLTQDYAQIWRTQPAVRTVISFLARNIASLGLHAFRRLSDTDRERLADHPLTELIAQPNPTTTRYRLLSALVHDLGIFDIAYWLKVGTPARPGVLRLPPQRVEPVGNNWIAATAYKVKGPRGDVTFAADRVVCFRGFNPDDSRHGSSPIEALRRILIEEYQAGRMREQVLRNGARISGYIERPADAPRWGSTGKERFKADWQAQYAGEGPQAGGTPILEDGMVFRPASQTAEQLQYIEARKLTREETAAAYFIPPPMVGILDHATFSNITEQHKMLYQDTLGPWLTMICEEIGLQLIPDLADSENVYVEFNLAEKLRGSFEEQAQQLQASVGAPWLLRNEARARMNLPALPDGDQLVTPLNVLVGGLASPRDTVPPPTTGQAAIDAWNEKVFRELAEQDRDVTGKQRVAKQRAPETYVAKHTEVLRGFFRRQGAAVRSALGAKADGWWDGERWDRELAEDLYKLAVLTSQHVAAKVLEDIGVEPDRYDVDRTLEFLKAVSERSAKATNIVTKKRLDEALASDDPAAQVANVFEVSEGSRAEQLAHTAVTTISAFATVEAAKQSDAGDVTKTWITGANPRPTHAAMNGETVGIDDVFSNGADWPGDGVLPSDEVAGCNCTIEITRG